MRKIFAILGKASVGKDTLTSYLSELTEYPIALSFTTRPMRKNEEQGREYNFISKDKFDWLKEEGKLAEYTSYNVASGETWYYGSTKDELEKAEYVVFIVNPQGLKQLKDIYGDRVCSILINADAKIRITRYLNRDVVDEQKVEECCRRFLADQDDFRNLKTDYVVKNESLEKAIKELTSIVKSVVAKDILDKVNEDFRNDPRGFINGNN